MFVASPFAKYALFIGKMLEHGRTAASIVLPYELRMMIKLCTLVYVQATSFNLLSILDSHVLALSVISVNWLSYNICLYVKPCVRQSVQTVRAVSSLFGADSAAFALLIKY